MQNIIDHILGHINHILIWRGMKDKVIFLFFGPDYLGVCLE